MSNPPPPPCQSCSAAPDITKLLCLTDEIIKEQKKAKRKQQQKQKKQPQKGKGHRKLTATKQGTKGSGPARKQQQVARKRRGNPQQQAARQDGPGTGVKKQVAGKQVKTGKPRIRASPLRNRQNLQGKV